MKQIIFFLIFPLFPAMAQTLSISYSIDTVGGRDSFFLVETISRTIPESTRPQETTTSILFRDTSELVAYIERLKTDRTNLTTRIDQMETQMTLLTARISEIEDLRDSVLPLLSPQNRVARPSERIEVVAPIIESSDGPGNGKAKATKPKKPKIKKQ